MATAVVCQGSEHPERVKQMTQDLLAYLESMQESHAGGDYDAPSFKPRDKWDTFKKAARP